MLRTVLTAGLMILTAGAWNAMAAEGGSSTLHSQALDAHSRNQQFGVGIQVGSLSGVNFEYWKTHDTTFNAALTFSRGNNAFSLTHLWMFQNTFGGDARAFVPFIGAGALGVWYNSSADIGENRNYNNDRFILAAQAPLGIEFLPSGQRFSVFGELAPSIEVTPYFVGFLTADIGARLFF
ncbi:MAG: hypothetical protein ACXVA9_02390 [Bdellovibrionales bacterium]